MRDLVQKNENSLNRHLTNLFSQYLSYSSASGFGSQLLRNCHQIDWKKKQDLLQMLKNSSASCCGSQRLINYKINLKVKFCCKCWKFLRNFVLHHASHCSLFLVLYFFQNFVFFLSGDVKGEFEQTENKKYKGTVVFDKYH